ncbi:hypothetical protein JCM17845_20980 [Iodidimonas gelatinilytica]|uniref:Uncharacterized protein n=1 Tax=Iodidimonas gelatinilytica TaxID=1236966 RepID=A0A5A7N180_9PROT|nr:hypothetical protein JCM17845_20980 [Iodidimonas gelatinilytica]
MEPERQRGDAGAVIFVTADDVGGRLRLPDPVIGDVLDILPLGDDGRGLAERNQYVDFDLLASAQAGDKGVVR